MNPREVIDVDGCSIVIEQPDPESFAEQREAGAVVQISASCWLGNKKQLNELIAKLVQFGNELDKQSVGGRDAIQMDESRSMAGL